MQAITTRWRTVRPVIGRDVTLCAACAVVAAVVTRTGLPTHRVWAWWALAGYALAVAVLLVRRWSGRPAALDPWLVGAVTVVALGCPLVQMAVAGQQQNEVTVVFEAARRLLGADPLYPTGGELAAAVASHGVDAYFPYLPAMAVLGVPAVWASRAGLGPVASDPRLVFVALYLAEVAFVLRRARVTPARLWLVLVASPLAALPLSTGGDDLPVVGALLVALVLSRDARPIAAGVVAGLACAAKLTAWPFLLVLTATRWRNGRHRSALAFATAAAGTATVFLISVLATSPMGLVVHDLRFPAGLEPVPSPAAAPFPGRLIAEHLPAGRAVALTLLALAAVGMAALLVVRPPRTEADAARFSAAGLCVATLLAPATRVGYLVYPLSLIVLAGALPHNPGVRDSRTVRVDAMAHA